MPVDFHHFPRLRTEPFDYTSPRTTRYNCIAWAAGDITQKWWPVPGYYWPPGVPKDETLDAFAKAYGTLGFVPCDSAAFERGFEKIALYVASNGKPTHAALQISATAWTSKLGDLWDIEHINADSLVGPRYGSPARFLRRPSIRP